MRRLGTTDLEILHLAVSRGGTFNENDLERSSLKRLGVGRILDALASLKDRDMISLNQDRTFSITRQARTILWASEVPVWARVLRLLQIKSCSMAQVAEILRVGQDRLEPVMEGLRRKQYVLMSPQRREGSLLRMYEILPDGVQRIDRTESEGFGEAGPGDAGSGGGEATAIIDEIQAAVSGAAMSQAEKDKITERIAALKKRIGV